jgi:hypothetical protein
VAKLNDRVSLGEHKVVTVSLLELELLTNSGFWRDIKLMIIPGIVAPFVKSNGSFCVQSLVDGAKGHARGITHASTHPEHFGGLDLIVVIDVDVYACAGRIRQIHVRPRVRLEDALVENGRGKGVPRSQNVFNVLAFTSLQFQQGVDTGNESGTPERFDFC